MWLTILFCSIILSASSTDVDELQLFEIFKDQYDKKYASSRVEFDAYRHFLQNLRILNTLNERDNKLFEDSGVHSYFLNKYADLDPEDVLDRYGVKILPFEYAKNFEEYKKKMLASFKQPLLSSLGLYDLNETKDIYLKYMEKFNKTSSKSSYIRDTHYYRFYKTLVELNNRKYVGENVEYDEDSDKIKEPHAFYFDEYCAEKRNVTSYASFWS